ncbi:MAG TPA: tyrosine--tRNA ligase [Xanthobacteraceae bacterium]|nr:tyrosine--tRNA ligase [Xanthobacteraceae bacterium]
MNTYKSDFLNVLATRGFIHQVSEPEALDALARSSTITGYIGFDCTASSLHVGSLLPIMLLYWLQQTGHRPIALMGGGTTRVGDPSGKDESRRLLSDEAINENLKGIREIFSRFLRFGDGSRKSAANDAIMANNADWLNALNYIDFLRDVGRHFSINRMLAFDSVKLRLERQQELSFLEFNYMILQAYDFVELYRRHGCVLQMGGTDQWGNIVNGIDLGRRLHNAQFFALTAPLITTSSGAKMGKTASGAVWLNADQVSPYEYWQYWRNTDDGDVARFLKLFTVLPLGEIDRLAALKHSEINEAKKILATEATALVHGRAAADEAAATARTTFEQGGVSEKLPTFELPRVDLKAGIGILTVFVKAGLAGSNGEVRRAIANNAIMVNDTRVTSDKATIGEADVLANGFVKLSLGRKRHVLLKPV